MRGERTGLALSIQQPWAWLIVNGHKPVENRSWPTRVRGRIGIHAGKKIDREGLEWIADEFPEIPLPITFETGGIVGSAVITDCVTEHPSEFFFGEFGFVFSDPMPLPLMPCKGRLGFFRPSMASSGGGHPETSPLTPVEDA